MTRQLLSLITLIFASQFLIAQNSFNQFVYFPSDGAALDVEDKNELNSIIEKSNAFTTYKIQIIGHTDQDGTDNYNSKLAKKRALAVKKYMLANGISKKHLNISAHGEKMLLSNGDDGASKSKNRRVEIIVDYKVLNSTEELISNISEVQLQTKEIDPTEENTITLAKGSIIDIPANSLVFQDGSIPQGKITIQAKETFTYADFINQDLHSSSKGAILETGGMVYIEAKAEGKEVFIKEGAAVEITYPEQEVKEDMQLFYGEGGHDDELDWVLDDNEISLKNKALPTDLKEILAYELAPVEKPQIGFGKMLAYPNLPRQPYDAREPKLPVKENLDLGLTKFQNSFMSKEKKERKRNALFDKKIKEYNKALVKYEEGHEKYLKKLAIYEVKKPQVEAAQQLWKEEMDMRLDSIYAYKKKRRVYVENERMQDALRYVKKVYGKKSDPEIFSTFYKISSGEVEVKKLSAEATHRIVFGKEFIRVVRMKGLDIRHIDKRLERSNTEYLKMIKYIDTKNFEKAFAKNGTMKAKNLNQYVASINQFGWINIDRFLKMGRGMLAGVRIPNESITTKFYCIFKESRSILQASFKENGFKFNNLPKGQAYKIIGIKLENGKPKMAVRDFTLTKFMNIRMDFRDVDLEEMKEEFAGLESFSM